MYDKDFKEFDEIIASYVALENSGHIEKDAVSGNVNWDEIKSYILSRDKALIEEMMEWTDEHMWDETGKTDYLVNANDLLFFLSTLQDTREKGHTHNYCKLMLNGEPYFECLDCGDKFPANLDEGEEQRHNKIVNEENQKFNDIMTNQTPPPTEKWEEELHKLLDAQDERLTDPLYKSHELVRPPIFTFIGNLLLSQKKEIAERVKALKFEDLEMPYAQGYNVAIDNSLNEIEK